MDERSAIEQADAIAGGTTYAPLTINDMGT